MPTINIVKTVSNLASVTGLSFTATAVQGVNTFPLTASYSAPNLTLTSAGNIGVSGNFTFNVTANYTAFGTACSDSISFVECKTNFLTNFRNYYLTNDSCGNTSSVYLSNVASYYGLITNTEFSNNNVTWVPPLQTVNLDCSTVSVIPLTRYSKSTFPTTGIIYSRLSFSDSIVLNARLDWSVGTCYVITSVLQLNDFQTRIDFAGGSLGVVLNNITVQYTSGIDNLVKTVNLIGSGAPTFNYLLEDRIKNQTVVIGTSPQQQSSLFVDFLPEVVC